MSAMRARGQQMDRFLRELRELLALDLDGIALRKQVRKARERLSKSLPSMVGIPTTRRARGDPGLHAIELLVLIRASLGVCGPRPIVRSWLQEIYREDLWKLRQALRGNPEWLREVKCEALTEEVWRAAGRSAASVVRLLTNAIKAPAEVGLDARRWRAVAFQGEGATSGSRWAAAAAWGETGVLGASANPAQARNLAFLRTAVDGAYRAYREGQKDDDSGEEPRSEI